LSKTASDLEALTILEEEAILAASLDAKFSLLIKGLSITTFDTDSGLGLVISKST
jgi:hypothetical protein